MDKSCDKKFAASKKLATHIHEKETVPFNIPCYILKPGDEPKE